MAEDNYTYPLHENVFFGNIVKLNALVESEAHDIAQKDKHGNTPLHLAVMLGREACVYLLLKYGAPVKIKNAAGWSPLAEAVSYGDRQIISSLVRALRRQTREQMEERRPNLVTALKQMGDFYMELKWDFQSWVPLVSRILPSDICRIHKKGSSIRLDTTLVDFNDMRWERGDISFLFNGDVKPNQSFTVLDNQAQSYQRIRNEETDLEIEDEVDLLMSSDITAPQMSTKSITFTRAKSGWFFRQDRSELVGPFHAEFYSINGMILESRKRREHLSEEDLQKNKAIMESFTKGNAQQLAGEAEYVRRKSLTRPPEPKVTWQEYLNAPAGEPPILGRQLVYKNTSKVYRATVGMSPDFPLSVDMLLNVLEVIAPFKHFTKLRKFVQMKLPPGFPVKIDIPVLATVTATITFQEFSFRNDIPSELFEIPVHYVEDPHRFPDL
ncbi:ankyrin repeat domain-containing protein 13C [Bemisia tabaci]